ncbi:Zn-dependent hydrolase [Rummeliibacillus pycnus]|uniref:Zn-dependent hydrolase n=1 Tax=Rummeliibacillus pycnus TaxID=101070 RepID=UPI0037CA1B48
MYTCNKSRLEGTLNEFSSFGKTPNNGVTRLCFSQEDVQARNYFRKCCEELGLDVVWDDMGNMYAKLEGKKDMPPIVIGSHLDSVEKGGRFDGVLGVLTGLEVVKTLIDHKQELDAPIVVMNFTNEEGARFDPAMMSSGVLANKFEKEKMLRSSDKNGVIFKDALEASGYVGDESNRLKKALAYLELHIEQGPVLESEELEIGVVEGVLGMVCYEITITGESNHAGTTPMKLRKDPFFLATDLITEMRKQLSDIDDELVFTMGRVNVTPNIHTVIPNKVVFTLEARHQDPRKIKEVEEVIFGLPEEENGCRVSFEKLWSRDTVEFDESICAHVQNACEEYSYSYKRMYSGAGHDAQFMASYIPSAMIFVPSVKGKSHCEEELTNFEDCAKGANVLLSTVLALQQKISKQELKTL